MLDLGEIREKIDGIDKQLVSLFEERMALCHSVAEYKISTGKKVLDTERENATGGNYKNGSEPGKCPCNQ
jgi:chorismate mutase/prephenate dehydratase